ncbi:MAG: BON domain-containing protein [Acidobacteria bacterium]|nr:MAG: BON domain-containing protein [Acidobacteriota bacterium]
MMKSPVVALVCLSFSTGLVLTPSVGSHGTIGPSGWRWQEPELRPSRDLVKKIQRKLAQQGYYGGAIDGIIGPQTREALRNFQRAHRLPVTGHIDEATIAELGIPLEEEKSQPRRKGLFGKLGSAMKKTGGAVAEGATTAAEATAKAGTTAAKATKKGAVTGAEATASGATTAGKATGKATATAGKATGKSVKATGKAIKRVFTKGRSDEQILYDVQDVLKADPDVELSHIAIGVDDGIVTLTLTDGSRSELERAATLARNVRGVKKVITRVASHNP